MDKVQFVGMSFEQVVDKYKNTVGAVCVMRLNNRYDADDCFQNTFFKLYKKSPDFNDEEHLKAWLIRVAINECKTFMRKNRPYISLDDSSTAVISFPQEKCDMSWALFELDAKYREVVYLYYCENYKVNEIAQILKKSQNTVKTLLRRGREKLKVLYGGVDDE
ncbi:MAG: sigma-70 family RNA polymerase sigma factor [Ruminococcus sp.]|nr:sigma-70 family RNA polymerase sigma factor [Ruminococcus sp.]